MALSWLSVDARTGVVLAELPNLVPQGPCAVTIGRYEQLGFTLPYPPSVVSYAQTGSPTSALQDLDDWNAATRPGASVLIALDESGEPCWGGLVLTRTKDQTEAASLATVTMEAYFDRRITGTYETIGEDQNQVVTDLINQFILDGTLPGIPIRVANTASAQTTSQTFNDYDDKTVYSNLQAMSQVLDGPQWTVGWEWQSSPVRVTPVLTVADRLGTATPDGLASPNALFSMPGSVTQMQLVEDWSAGKGANRVTATGSGQGLTRPEDTEVVSNYAGRPTFEYRYAPPQTALSTLTVQQHALAALMALQNGGQVMTLTSAIQDAPILGVDWVVGDDIGYDILAPGFIDGSLQNGVGTTIGWQRDDQTITPVLFTQDASQL